MHTRVYIVLHLIILHTHLAGLPAEFAIAGLTVLYSERSPIPSLFLSSEYKTVQAESKATNKLHPHPSRLLHVTLD